MGRRPQGLRSWLVNGLLIALSTFAAMLMCEMLIGYALSHPGILASKAGRIFNALDPLRSYYMRMDRRIVQFLPECAVYDSVVTYRLKPGVRCTVVNREHTVEYAGNSAGLRDEDTSLQSPAIVVTGDSYALGWGVSSAEAFPTVLQSEMGVKVLNAGMSSYGTAREMALIEQLRLEPYGALVIQYCPNDYTENKALFENAELDILPREEYEQTIQRHSRATRYYPFKHVRGLVGSLRLSLAAIRDQEPVLRDTDLEEARYFLEVLMKYRQRIELKTVVVLELDERNRNNDLFIDAVMKLLDDRHFALLKPVVSVVPVSGILTDPDYYLLDDHLRPSGHAKVAGAVAQELRRRGLSHAR